MAHINFSIIYKFCRRKISLVKRSFEIRFNTKDCCDVYVGNISQDQNWVLPRLQGTTVKLFFYGILDLRIETLRLLRRFLKYGLAALRTTLWAEQLLPSAEMVTWKAKYKLKVEIGSGPDT